MDYTELIEAFRGKRVMIVGDVMVDAYWIGTVDRISPEAPVPVVSVKKHDNRLGGAANVALNIAALGAEPLLCGVLGNDDGGKLFSNILKENKISDSYLHISESRPTTTKMRIVGNTTQLLRVDEEITKALEAEEEKMFINKCLDLLRHNNIDALIFEDYDKGAVTPLLIEMLVKEARELKIPISVDPKKRNFLCYKGVDLFKPNLKEMKEGLKIDNLSANYEDVAEAAEKLRSILDAKMLMVTLSENGVLLRTEHSTTALPAQIRQIADVSGAGDTVISVATLCLALGLPAEEIAYISNMAGGLVCEYAGVVPIKREELIKELQTKKKSL